MRMKSFSNFCTLLLALAGCIVAIVLTYEEYHPKADIGCSVLGGDCSKTINSKYGHLGPIPTSLIGLGMYLTIGGLCLFRHKKLIARRQAEQTGVQNYTQESSLESSPEASLQMEALSDPALKLRGDIKTIEGALWGIATLGVIISWWLQYTSVFVLNSFCPWCLSSAILVLLIFLFTSYDFLIEGRKLEGEQKLLAGISVFIAICFGVVFVPTFIQRIMIIHQVQVEDVPEAALPSVREMVMRDKIFFKGDQKAKFTLIEFADYQCPHCKEAAEKVDVFLKHPPVPIRFGFRNFPLENHQNARQAALAAEAAGEQGKFWQMHDFIFQHQKDLEALTFSQETFTEWAGQLHLNEDRFDKDRNSDQLIQRVAKDRVIGEACGVSMTPCFFLITPTQVTKIPSAFSLEKIWNNPKDKAWQ